MEPTARRLTCTRCSSFLTTWKMMTRRRSGVSFSFWRAVQLAMSGPRFAIRLRRTEILTYRRGNELQNTPPQEP